jgi:hypothetical protein
MSRLRTLSLCAVLLGMTVTAYLPLWRNDLIDFDDEIYITSNPRILEGLSWPGCYWAWTNDNAPYWHPLTWLSLQFDAHCFSTYTPQGQTILCPAAFHGQNLLWHAASVLLLFTLWQRLTGACWRSFLVAALFAVHPMHVESVAWAIERKDVLSGFFGLLAVWMYLRYVENPGWKWYLGLVVAYLLSLLSKPMLITLPFVLLLLDYWPLRRLWPTNSPADTATGRSLKPASPAQLIREKLPLFGMALWIAGVTFVARQDHGAMVPLCVVSPSARLANGLTAYGWYLSTTLWPCRLAVLYPHLYDNWSLPSVLAGAGALVAITALSLWQARRRPWLLTGWLWFAGMLVPVLGLAQGGAQAWADRFSYWPHIGLFVALVWGLGELVERLRLPVWVSGIGGALLLGTLAVLTWIQVGYWRDSLTLWEHAVAVTRDNERAHQHVANYYRKQDQEEEADFHLAEAARIQLERMKPLFKVHIERPDITDAPTHTE